MHAANGEDSQIGRANAEWLGRLITRVELSVDKLASKIEGLEGAIATDMKELREGFRREVNEVETRVNTVENRVAQLEVSNRILAAIGGAALVGLIALAVPKIWGTQPHSQPSAPAQSR